jgi:transcriptional regulator with XRE-family HTH domain
MGDFHMTLPEKLEILIRRKGITKTEAATLTGITYRALANYIAGGRRPRKSILAKMAEILGTTPEFLTDEGRSLILSSEERFVFYADSPELAVNAGLALLDECRRVLGAVGEQALSANDKRALFSCMSEVYFDAKGRG